MIQLIESILREWLKLWKLRNEDRHGRDAESQQQAETKQMIRELEQFYAAHNGTVTPRLQWLFEEPLEVRCEKNIGIIIQWLNTWKTIVEKSYNSLDHRMTLQENPSTPNSSTFPKTISPPLLLL